MTFRILTKTNVMIGFAFICLKRIWEFTTVFFRLNTVIGIIVERRSPSLLRTIVSDHSKLLIGSIDRYKDLDGVRGIIVSLLVLPHVKRDATQGWKIKGMSLDTAVSHRCIYTHTHTREYIIHTGIFQLEGRTRMHREPS